MALAPVNLSQNLVASTGVEKPQPILSLLTFRGNQNIQAHVLSFLQPRELAAVEATNKVWRQVAEPCWRTQAHIQGMVPEVIPNGMSYRQIFKTLYPRALGLQVYKDHWENAKPLVPFPPEFITKANRPDSCSNPGGKIKDKFQLTFLPQFITITVSNDSTLTLNENGSLIEDPTAAGRERQIDVPVDLKNMTILTEKCLKQGNPTGFGKYYSWADILDQHGDKRIKSHWFYPRENVIGCGQSFAEQQATAIKAELEVTPLIDTAIYYLLRQIREGNADSNYIAYTSTPDSDGLPSALCWQPSGPEARLYVQGYRFQPDGDNVGIAVGVPVTSSQVIGPIDSAY